MSAPYTRGCLNSQKKYHSMGGTKNIHDMRHEKRGAKTPIFGTGQPHRGRSSVLFLWFFTKKCYPQKNPFPTGAILMVYLKP